MTEWVRFDPKNPPPHEYVWVFDRYYLGVTVGYWNSHQMCTVRYRDDCSVSHWMLMDLPPPPTKEQMREVDEE